MKVSHLTDGAISGRFARRDLTGFTVPIIVEASVLERRALPQPAARTVRVAIDVEIGEAE